VTWNPNSPPNDFIIQPVLVTGTNFSPAAVAWFNSPCDTLGLRQALSTTRTNDKQITATILIRCAGNYSIAIANPQPGGGLSQPAILNVPSVTASMGIGVGAFIIPTGGGSTTDGTTDGVPAGTTDGVPATPATPATDDAPVDKGNSAPPSTKPTQKVD
jgi:hypothetical protein